MQGYYYCTEKWKWSKLFKFYLLQNHDAGCNEFYNYLSCDHVMSNKTSKNQDKKCNNDKDLSISDIIIKKTTNDIVGSNNIIQINNKQNNDSKKSIEQNKI